MDANLKGSQVTSSNSITDENVNKKHILYKVYLNSSQQPIHKGIELFHNKLKETYTRVKLSGPKDKHSNHY